MTHADIHSIPDDPHRVAPPYCAPGEVEPPDAPQVSNKEATDRVAYVLLANDKNIRAFGHSADEWNELLLDFMATHQQGKLAQIVLAAILDTGKPSLTLLPFLRGGFERFIGDTANQQLAEMSPDELEAEGFTYEPR